MRRLLLFLWVVLLVPMAAAEGAHSPSIRGAAHFPNGDLERGQDVRIVVGLHAGTTVDGVRLVYCRVEGYLCAAPLSMQLKHGAPGQDQSWETVIPWDRPEENRPARFWSGVTHVGYTLTLIHSNGTIESSPIENFPETPAGFTSDAKYYFYTLPPEPKRGIPMGTAMAAIGVALLAALRKPAWP